MPAVTRQPYVSIVIPARNEAARIGSVVKECLTVGDEVIVIDDGSTDLTSVVAERAGAKVLKNTQGRGYIGAIKTGFAEAHGDIVVTIDGDGEHSPRDIPRLVEPVVRGWADLALGRREKIQRFSERLISLIVRLRTGVADSGTGFRALRKELATRLRLPGRCTCGVFVLEACSAGARIAEVPVHLNVVDKKRKIAWSHFYQVFHVLKMLCYRKSSDRKA